MKVKKHQVLTLSVLFSLIFLIIPLIFNPDTVTASSRQPPISQNEINISAKSAIAVDATSGQIIYDKNVKQQLPIASVSKLITTYIVLNQIQAKKISWDSKVKISPKVASLSQGSDFTNVPLQAGKSYTVKQLYDVSLICSANAAAMALGEYLAGPNHDFGKMMSQEVNKLGIKNAQLYNACGLANSDLGALKDPNLKDNAENTMSAEGLAQLSQELITHHPEILKTTSMTSLKWDGKVYKNTNLLLGQTHPFKIDGLKTGTSDTAGENFVGTGTSNHDRIITVVLGAPKDQRFTQTQLMLNQISQNLFPTTIGANVLPTKAVNVINGVHKTTKIGPASPKTYWLPQGEKIKTDFVSNHNSKIFKTPLAPITKGEKVGTVNIKAGSDELDLLSGSETSVPVVYKVANPVNVMKMIMGALELLVILLLLIYLIFQIRKFNLRRH
ncbi:d-alanyl-d-alanine carboxypeptidase [Fructilactobacillus fructivorans]|uniref:D-alanyl-D-alanine carboxypeptidase family protein n=1 Tax=Fructilactobacillus fructivorans TaxID=1614 RepID=UPI00070529F7|nr:D-alanyl-D-alanine carboxypeptidase family protein [Fructilactobacillus fructivorans]KRN13147.1 d-alanyl-d-alanine carboxypeptidase [Fructilactobacillus fructivorans]